MTLSHEPWLVLLSLLVAVQGSYVGLSLAGNLDQAEGFRRRALLAGAALTLATGVWSMHFVGMLAAQFPSRIDYLAFPTLLSFLICVMVVGVGVYATHTDGPRFVRIGGGALAMGLGISLMHYVGMRAVHLSGPYQHEPPFVAASIVVSIGASAVALWSIDRPHQSRQRVLAAALLLGLAISGMHYTAMAGMRLDPLCFDATRFVDDPSALSRGTLAILTTVVAFGVSAAFLLSLVPDGRPRGDASPARFAEAELAFAQSPSATDAMPAPGPAPIGIGRAGADQAGAESEARLAKSLGVEKDGKPRRMPVDEIVAVRANAHYTYIHNGEQEFFCNLSISAIEARLDPARFMRVHRSYIVALDRVGQLRRAGENGIVEFAAPAHGAIPVSRSQYRQVKRRLEAGFI